MAKLYYKTQMNTRLGGKSKVYFGGNPADFDRYFENIAALILRMYDVALCVEERYLSGKEGYPSVEVSESERADNLKEATLFVLLVSKKSQESQWEEVTEFYEIAKLYNIPILPIVVDNIDEELFRTKFKETQYLSLVSKRENELSFEERMEGYLKDIFVSQKIVQKIHAMFSAHIFLSYRKKDRKLAEALIRKIHKFTEFESVGIWYDEFLIPGEDYNENIDKEIKKCDLFVMCMTPNMIDTPNYVNCQEYPRALEYGKPIVMVEMEKTSAEGVEQYYPLAGTCIDSEDEETLKHVFRSAIEALKNETAIWTEEMDYLLGVAYLEGIGVETDREKAYKYIYQAAKKGWMDAYYKLISMYQNGNGVPVDYLKAIELRDELIVLCKEKAYYTNREDYIQNLYQLHLEQGDDYSRLFLYDNAFEHYSKMVMLAEKRLEVTNGYPQWKMRLADACLCASEVAKSLCRNDVAEFLAKRGLEYIQELLAVCMENKAVLSILSTDESFGIFELNRKCMYFNYMLGRIAHSRLQSEEALKYFERAAELGDIMNMIEGDRVQSKKDLVHCYEAKMFVCILKDKREMAQKHLAELLQLLNQFYQETDDMEYIIRQVQVLVNIADKEMRMGDLNSANMHLQNALSRECYISEKRKVFGEYLVFAGIYRRLAFLSYSLKCYDEVMLYAEKTLSVLQKLDESVKRDMFYEEQMNIYIAGRYGI